MATEPLVSVLLPVHNGMPYLPQCLASLWSQTLTDFELIVVDDGSTDETPNYLRSVQDPRLSCHRCQRAGQAEAMNYGLRVARAPLIARMDADDLAEPSRLAKQYAYLQANPDCVLLGCQGWVMDREGTTIAAVEFPRADAAIRWQMLFDCPFLHPGVMYRRAAVLAVGGYCREFESAEDYALWTRLARLGKLANHPDKLLRYRWHPASVTNTKALTQRRLATMIAGQYGHHWMPALEPAAIAALHAFARFGWVPQSASLTELAQTYRQLRNHFAAGLAVKEDELLLALLRMDRQLRWRCLHQVRVNWRQPWTCWTWILAARCFDPENTTTGKILLRLFNRQILNRLSGWRGYRP